MKYGIRVLLTRQKRFFYKIKISPIFFPDKPSGFPSSTVKKGKKRHFWHFYMYVQNGLKSSKMVKKYVFSYFWKIDTKSFQIHFIGLNFDRNSLRYVIFNFDHFLRFSKKSIFWPFWPFLLFFTSQNGQKIDIFENLKKWSKLKMTYLSEFLSKFSPIKWIWKVLVSIFQIFEKNYFFTILDDFSPFWIHI